MAVDRWDPVRDLRHLKERVDTLFQDVLGRAGTEATPEASGSWHPPVDVWEEGGVYHVRVDLTVPGREIVVSRDPAENHAHEDVYVAIRDAFDATRRQLEDHVREIRADVKHHEPARQTGHVRAIVAEERYGFIASDDGREIYFHENSVLDGGFGTLSVGSRVSFVEAAGNEGPQASSVWPAE